jgi:hypothetical protein
MVILGGAMELNAVTGLVIRAAIEVHRVLGGPGLLEDIYESALVFMSLDSVV